MRRVLAATAALLFLSAGAAHADTNEPVDTLFPRGLPWSVTDDRCLSTVKRCVWHAPSRGWGDGRSHIITRYRGDWLVTNVDHKRAGFLAQAFCDRPTVQDCEVY